MIARDTGGGPAAITLEFTDPYDGQRYQYFVRPAGATFGRDDRCDIRLRDRFVNRRHARLYADEDGRWVLEDLGSMYGTRINRELITRGYVACGDEIQIADVRMRVGRKESAFIKFQNSKISKSRRLRDGVAFLLRLCYDNTSADGDSPSRKETSPMTKRLTLFQRLFGRRSETPAPEPAPTAPPKYASLDFRECGWTHTEPVDGVGFVIEVPEDVQPELYYCDDDMRGPDDIPWVERLAEGIARYSRGLRNVHVHVPKELAKPKPGDPVSDRLCIRFTLADEDRDKPLPLYGVGWQMTAEDVRDPFVLILPRCGEFRAELGEVRAERYLPVRTRSFCMK